MAEGELTVEDIRALIQAGPPTGIGQSLPPIGVPEVVMGRDRQVEPFRNARDAETRYFEGHQVSLLAALPPEEIAQLQYLMVAAGVIPKRTQYLQGRIDDVTVRAFTTVLSHANRSGMNPEMALRDLASAEKIGVDPDAPAQYLAPDPARVREDIRDFFQAKVKRAVTDDEMQPLYDEYLRLSRTQYDSNVPGASTDVDPAARFSEFLTDRYAPEIQRSEAVVDLAANNNQMLTNVFRIGQQITG